MRSICELLPVLWQQHADGVQTSVKSGSPVAVIAASLTLAKALEFVLRFICRTLMRIFPPSLPILHIQMPCIL